MNFETVGTVVIKHLATRLKPGENEMKKTVGTVFTCQSCGHQSPKWLGKCPECGEWNSVEERATVNRKNTNRSGFKLREVKAVTYAD